MKNFIDYINSYNQCFCKVIKNAKITEYVDDSITDMYCHNYYFSIGNDLGDKAELINTLVEKRIAENKSFCRISFPCVIDSEILSGVKYPCEVEKTGVYFLDFNKMNVPNIDGYRLVKADKDNYGEFIALNLRNDGDKYPDNFTFRKISACENAYLSGKIDCYAAENSQGELTASVEYFLKNGVLQLENLFTEAKYQHKGAASFLFHNLINKAIKENVKEVFLLADEEDTPKEMYKNFGFEKCGDMTELQFNLTLLNK